MTIDLTIKKETLDSDFKRIAFELMNHWILKTESKLYRISEIEFYLKGEFHYDTYTHGHKLQKDKGRWYFHGSGMDITCGENDFYGGILIRAIYDIENAKYIYGPLNCITELFSNIDVHETKVSFGLIPAKENTFQIETPIAVPRVGLNVQKDTGKYGALYRFFVMPKQKHAEKTKIAESMKQQGYPESEIKNIWG